METNYVKRSQMILVTVQIFLVKSNNNQLLGRARRFLFWVYFYLIEHSTILASEILSRKHLWVEPLVSAITNGTLTLASAHTYTHTCASAHIKKRWYINLLLYSLTCKITISSKVEILDHGIISCHKLFWSELRFCTLCCWSVSSCHIGTLNSHGHTSVIVYKL